MLMSQTYSMTTQCLVNVKLSMFYNCYNGLGILPQNRLTTSVFKYHGTHNTECFAAQKEGQPGSEM